MMKHCQRLILFIIVGLLSGCASVVPKGQTPDIDPFETTNRKLYAFNKQLDYYVLEPTAKGYQAITPDFMRRGIRHMFSNVKDVPNTANYLLQLEPKESAMHLSRFGINTTVGLFGFFDVATQLGLKKHDTYFGETLQKWGVLYSPYVFLPVFGPSTVRDTAGMWVDSRVNPVYTALDDTYQVAYRVINGISVRESLLDKKELFDTLSFDEYLFVRNAYLQKIGAELPHEDADDEFSDEFNDGFD